MHAIQVNAGEPKGCARSGRMFLASGYHIHGYRNQRYIIPLEITKDLEDPIGDCVKHKAKRENFMKADKLNMEYELLLQKAKLSSNITERKNNTIVRSIDHIYFAICNANESFRIEYNVTRGMQMEFYRNNKIVDRQESPEQQIIPV